MPSWRPGPPASLQAAARRWLKSEPRWPTTSKPGGSHGPGLPSRARTLRDAPQAATEARVSASAASATAAASSGEHGGQSRVFTRPGRGSLAMTRTWGEPVRGWRFMRGGGPCPGWPGPFPAAFPSPSMPRTGGRRGRRPRRCASRRPLPAAPSPAASRSAGPGDRGPAVRRGGRRASGRGRRAGWPVRRRSSSASRRLATRAWIGQAAVVVGRRAPRTRSAAPARTGPATAGRSRGVEGAVAVHEADDAVGRVGGQQPGPAGRTETGRRLVDDVGAGGTGEIAGAVGGAVVDHQRPVTGRHGGDQGGDGRRFVEDGNDDIGHGTVVSGGLLRIAGGVLTIR